MSCPPLRGPERITFDRRFKEAIQEGRKTLTTRKLTKKAAEGDYLLCVSPERCCPGFMIPKRKSWAVVQVEKVYVKAPIDLTNEEILAEGFSNPFEYQEVLLEKNPGIDLREPMKLIQFSLYRVLTPKEDGLQ
jgi:hypothetical protein